MAKPTKKLTLVLLKKHFDLIYSGTQKEIYREISHRYVEIFFEWQNAGITLESFTKDLLQLGNNSEFWLYYKKFDYDFLELEKKLNKPGFMIEFGRMTIATGRPEWGAKPGTKYFVLKLGSIWAR